jgi:hypothetical protein
MRRGRSSIGNVLAGQAGFRLAAWSAVVRVVRGHFHCFLYAEIQR